MKQEKLTSIPIYSVYTSPLYEAILHDIPLNRKKCGIYKIMFGDKYYIGQSIHIVKRAKVHYAEINKSFSSGKGVRVNIIEHLKKNKSIHSMHVYILELCSESELQKTEQKWLSICKDDKNCLNSVFTAHLTPAVRLANIFTPKLININVALNTQKELNLYNKFMWELNQIKANPKVKLQSKFGW